VQTETDTAVPQSRAAIGSALGSARARLAGAVAERFRLPTPDDPSPEQRRLVIVSLWCCGLGVGGAAIALRVLLSLFQVDAGWYVETMFAIGLVGLLCTVGAFVSLHRRILPLVMLSLATAALAAAMVVTARG
jgi:hypothetical protein